MKRPYFQTASKVAKRFDANPRWTSGEIARALGLHPAYVRKTLKRKGRRLARSQRR